MTRPMVLGSLLVVPAALSLALAAPALSAALPDDSLRARFAAKFEEPVVPAKGAVPAYPLPVPLRSVQGLAETSAAVGLPAEGAALLRMNGFVVGASPLGDTPAQAYAKLAGAAGRIVTADVVTHVALAALGAARREVENGKLAADLLRLTTALKVRSREQGLFVGGELREAAQRNHAFFAVAEQLLAPGRPVTEDVLPDVEAELRLLYAGAGVHTSPVMGYSEDYAAHAAPPTVAGDDASARFWRARRWYGRACFAGEVSPLADAELSRRLTLQAMLVAHALAALDFGGEPGDVLWTRIYGACALFDGWAVFPTPADYLAASDELYGRSPSPSVFPEEPRYGRFRQTAPFRRFRTERRTLRADASAVGLAVDRANAGTVGMRFLPLPYGGDPDLALAPAGAPRGLPRSLDLFAALGSSRARTLLFDLGDDAAPGFDEAVAAARRAWSLRESAEGTSCVRTVLLRAFLALATPGRDGHPTFLTSDAWAARGLLAASAAAVRFRLPLSPAPSTAPVPAPGSGDVWLEPAPVLYTRLWSALRLARGALGELGYGGERSADALRDTQALLVSLEHAAEEILADRALPPDAVAKLKALCDGAGAVPPGWRSPTAGAVALSSDGRLGIRVGASLPLQALVAVCPFPDGRYVACAGPVFGYAEGDGPDVFAVIPAPPTWASGFWLAAPKPSPVPSPRVAATPRRSGR